MTRKYILLVASLSALGGWLGTMITVRADSLAPASGPLSDFGNPLAYLLTWFLPLGIALVAVGISDPRRAPQVVTSLPLALAAALIGYYLCGFAFQFGGLGLISTDPAFSRMIAEWSPLDLRLGPGWGLLGLRGFMLGGDTSGGPLLGLFLAQLPLVTTAALLPLVTMNGRMPRLPGFFLALLTSCVAYPLVGNWIQGGGWLSQLGGTLQWGAGLVDAGPSWIHLVGAGAALAGLVAFRRRDPDVSDSPPELPRAYLPLNVLTGAILTLVGWLALQFTRPWSMSVGPAQFAIAPTDIALLMFHALVAVSAATLTTACYSWLARGEPDPGLMGRGILAALIAVGAGLPYLPTWVVVLVAGLAGLLLAPLMFLVEHILGLDDQGAVVATHGFSAILGLLAVGLFADGGRGVDGYWAATGANMGQLNAQLIGIGSALVISALLPWSVLAIIARGYLLPERVQAQARERAARLRAEREAREVLRLRGISRAFYQRALARYLHWRAYRRRHLARHPQLGGWPARRKSTGPAYSAAPHASFPSYKRRRPAP